MAFKTFMLDEDLSVTVYKRKGARSLHLAITPDGTVRVTIPTWVPYSTGTSFARSRKAWIATQQIPGDILQPAQAIGKAHHLHYVADNTISQPLSRVTGAEIRVTYPAQLAIDHPTIQQAARKASVRALRSQAEALLPRRLNILAHEQGFSFKSVSIKQLKGRWGSCDVSNNIVLNLFLMQLPWSDIDYVLLHELTHTEHLNHSPAFWQRLSRSCPDYKQRKLELRKHKPVVMALGPI